MDREIRALQVATARAYAVAGRLAEELDNTVADLMRHVERARLEEAGSKALLAPSSRNPHDPQH